MNNFHHGLSFQSFEAAVNGVARLARTQGFRIHQRKPTQKAQTELREVASFGCTAPGCGWFISFKRIPLDGPSTSSAPAEQWVVYTVFDNHRSTCKPARSRRRRPSISSITSLETEDTEDELPPELLRPYERSPSLPILMHPRGHKPIVPTEAVTSASAVDPRAEQGFNISEETHGPPSDPPDPIALSNYIQELLASLEPQAVQSDSTRHTIDPQALLASLKEPLPLPTGFPFSTLPGTTFPSQLEGQATYSSHQPFSGASSAGQLALRSGSSEPFKFHMDQLPDQFQRATSILHAINPQTINPSELLSPTKQNGYTSSAPPKSIFDVHSRQDAQSDTVASNPYQEYTAPVSTDDWSEDDDEDEDDNQQKSELNHSFMQHDSTAIDEAMSYQDDPWPFASENAPDGQVQSVTEQSEEESLPMAPNVESEDISSSSDSDIPAEKLLNVNTSRSSRSNRSSSTVQDEGAEPPPNVAESYQPEPMDDLDVPETYTAPSTAASIRSRSTRPAYFPPQPELQEPEEHFDIYNIFYSFEEAETAILANARRTGVPLKIRYRPNLLGGGKNARKQACLECLRLCGYRIYLKDDHRGQWRVTNMEGGHKAACLQGKAKTKVRRGTNPFRVHRPKEKDSMEVTMPVWQSSGSKRKRREESFSSDRSSSPSIFVVTHSDAVMKSVRTVGPGFTPPPDYWHPSLASVSPTPVKKAKTKSKGKGKGKGKAREDGRTPGKPIELPDSDVEDDAVQDANYEPVFDPTGEPDNYALTAANNFFHPDVRSAEKDTPPQDQYARKKLPTAAQLLHGSGRNGIKPRHKIPTKPLGRSPFKTRQRMERRQGNGGGPASYLTNSTGASAARLKYGFLPNTLAGESSANDDDDEDMYYQTGRFSQRTLGTSQSSRALRSARRRESAQTDQHPLQSSYATRQAGNHNRAFHPSTAPVKRPNQVTKSSLPERALATPPSTRFKKGIHPNITGKMSLQQAGFTKEETLFLNTGGYTTVKSLAREGLACTVEDFATFRSWLGEILPTVRQDRYAQATVQSVRNHVKILSEEVRVRSTIIWEAAGMMEEGSDAEEARTSPGPNYYDREAENTHANGGIPDDAWSGDRPSKKRKQAASDSNLVRMENSRHSYINGHNRANETSGSSDIEFLGVQP